MARIRTFVAVDIGKAIRDRAAALQESLARAGVEFKWTERDNLHITLLFLGEVEDKKVPAVCRLVADAAQGLHPFTASVEGVGCFPNPRRPRILWVGVGDGAQSLCALHDALEAPLEGLGFRREERRYTPHITLGRVRAEGPADLVAKALTRHTGWKGGETLVREALVMASELGPQAPKYTVLGRAPLRGPTGPSK